MRLRVMTTEPTARERLRPARALPNVNLLDPAGNRRRLWTWSRAIPSCCSSSAAGGAEGADVPPAAARAAGRPATRSRPSPRTATPQPAMCVVSPARPPDARPGRVAQSTRRSCSGLKSDAKQRGHVQNARGPTPSGRLVSAPALPAPGAAAGARGQVLDGLAGAETAGVSCARARARRPGGRRGGACARVRRRAPAWRVPRPLRAGAC
jgi:hypothetical protein